MPLNETQTLHGWANKSFDGKLHPIVPVRLLDTRVGQIACITPGAIITAAGTRTYQVVSGCTKIPGEAVAIVGGVLAVNNTASGFIAIWPSNAARPLISQLNYNLTVAVTGRTFVTSLSPDGKISVYSSADTDAVIDIYGYFIA